MRPRKIPVFLFLFFLSSFLFSQSLAEIAKKERERREGLKGKRTTVVTNADLAKLKKKPALEMPPASPVPETEEVKAPEISPAPPQPAEELRSTEPALPGAEGVNLKALQEKYDNAKEYVELLTLKMGALWQQYYSLSDMTVKGAVEQAIGETFIKLERAQEEETKARQELEKFLKESKKEVPSLWIR